MATLKSSNPARNKRVHDPILVELFAASPTTARRSYERNVDDLIADLDAAAARTRSNHRSIVAKPKAIATVVDASVKGTISKRFSVAGGDTRATNATASVSKKKKVAH